MAVHYEGSSASVSVMVAGSWVALEESSSNWWGQAGFMNQAWELYRNSGPTGSVWDKVLTTDKNQPSQPPGNVSCTHTDMPLLRNTVHVNFTVASGMPLPEAAYEILVNLYNETNPARNAQDVLAAGATHVSPVDFVDAGDDDDVVHATLEYREAGMVEPFYGPLATTDDYTLT